MTKNFISPQDILKEYFFSKKKQRRFLINQYCKNIRFLTLSGGLRAYSS